MYEAFKLGELSFGQSEGVRERFEKDSKSIDNFSRNKRYFAERNTEINKKTKQYGAQSKKYLTKLDGSGTNNNKSQLTNMKTERNQNCTIKNSKHGNSNNNENKLRCIYMNARSIVNKIKELKVMIEEENVDIIAITETWLNDNVTDDEVSINGYTLFRKDRRYEVKCRGGGVAM